MVGSDTSWSKVSGTLTDDGSDEMLALLVSNASGYKEWAEEYFEVSVDLGAVSTIFSHQPISKSLILAVNPDAELDFTYTQALEIGYPREAA